MADCKRKTANLFSDKLIGMTWWDGVITADERFTLYIAEVKPNTEYTASGNNSVDNIMVTYYSVYPAEGQSSVESVRYVYPTNPTRSVAAFTTPDDSRIKYAAVRFGSDATDVMFNLGSIAFTYEPYGWVHSLRKLSTDTDTITTLPADIFPNAETATVGLKGQTIQNGTPTPQNPVMPQGTGERTGNIVAAEADRTSPMHGLSVVWKKGGSEMIIDGKATGGDSARFATFELDAGTYTLSITGLDETGWTKTGFYLSGVDTARVQGARTYTITEPTIARLQFVVNASDISYENRKVTIMFTKTSTPLPYEPYGYKIPISSASTTTPVYLGEVESTRQIKKYEFTGTESISSNTLGVSGVGFTFLKRDMLSNGRKNGYCSHFVPQNSPNGSALDGISFGASDSVIYVTFSVQSASDYNLTDITSVKAWLAQQYAAGTPVTVWYVLATPTTGIVNEPIRKIGEYADEVSNVSIPVTAGGDTISVDTTLQPSEVTVNYKGWHPVQSVHEKSRNLLDYTTVESTSYATATPILGGITISGRYYVQFTTANFTVGRSYTMSWTAKTISGTVKIIWRYRYSDNTYSPMPSSGETLRPEKEVSALLLYVNGSSTESGVAEITNIMLNEGSTALPYEPYWN